MDLENELREAMAEHVSGVSAPATLAKDARRAHRKTVRVRALAVAGAAAAVAFVAAMPAYQAFRPEPVGAPGHTPDRAPASGSALSSQKPVQGNRVPSGPQSARPEQHRYVAPPAPIRSGRGGGDHLSRLLSYIPPGLRQTTPCATARTADRETTACRWSGPDGNIEVKLVRGPALGGPADLGLMPPITSPAQVHDQPALRGDWMDTGSQVSWIERPELGVWLGVSASLNDQLMRIAEGVRVPS